MEYDNYVMQSKYIKELIDIMDSMSLLGILFLNDDGRKLEIKFVKE